MNLAPLTRKIPTQMPEAVLKERVCKSRMLLGVGSGSSGAASAAGDKAYERSLSHFSAFDCDDASGSPSASAGRESPTASRYEVRNFVDCAVRVGVDVQRERLDRSGAWLRIKRGRGETRNIDIVGENKQRSS